MNLKDFMYVNDGAMLPSMINELNQYYQNNTHTDSGIANNELDPSIRLASEFNFTAAYQHTTLHNELVRTTLSNYKLYKESLPVGYAKHLPSKNSDISIESFRFKHYKKGDGYYNEHVDGVGNRMLAVIFYLNTVINGGETEFCNSDISPVNALLGRVLIFPTTWQYPHKGCMPISSDKLIIQGYINDDRNA